MKKTRVYLVIIGILFLTISCVQKNDKSDKNESQKRPLADYKSQKLVTFYKEYGDEISDFTIVHTNEIFNAVIFYTKEKRAYVVELDTTIAHHPNPKEKIGKILEFNQFGIDNSIIKYIEFK